AERLCRHHIALLGYGQLDLGESIDWHRDPLSGRRWPRRFWSDYDLVSGCGELDPKLIHELNRHQHLPRLAKAYFLTGDERYARGGVAQSEGWIAQNSRPFAINWTSSLEIAFRAISWIWTIFFLLPSAALDDEAADRIGMSLRAQLEHVHKFPSVFS